MAKDYEWDFDIGDDDLDWDYETHFNKERTPQSTTPPIVKNQKFCKFCGAAIPNESKFCSTCGKNLVEPEKNVENMRQTPNPAPNSGSISSDIPKSTIKVDPLFIEAGRLLIDKDKATIGMLQRAFKIGFNRAGRIMDDLCEYKVVSEELGITPRKILMTKTQFEKWISGVTIEPAKYNSGIPIAEPESKSGLSDEEARQLIKEMSPENSDDQTEKPKEEPIPNQKTIDPDSIPQDLLIEQCYQSMMFFYDFNQILPSIIVNKMHVTPEMADFIIDSLEEAKLITCKYPDGKRRFRYSKIAIQTAYQDHSNKEKIKKIAANNINDLSGEQFEELCMMVLEKNGYYDISGTKTSGDHGVDILASLHDIKYAIQCKHYSGNVGNKAVQEAYSGASFYKVDIAVVMTYSHFTKQAQEEAGRLRVKLWDKEYLDGVLHFKEILANK